MKVGLTFKNIGLVKFIYTVVYETFVLWFIFSYKEAVIEGVIKTESLVRDKRIS